MSTPKKQELDKLIEEFEQDITAVTKAGVIGKLSEAELITATVGAFAKHKEAIEDYTTKKIDHELTSLIKNSVWKSHVPNEQIKERITELRAKAKETK